MSHTAAPRDAPRTRKTDRVKAVAASADQVPSVETVGVGIVLKPSFQSDTFLALVVHSLVPGSSAEQSRMIQVGALPARVLGREEKERFGVGRASRCRRASRRSAAQCEAVGSRIVLSRADGLLPRAAWLCRRVAWGHLHASARPHDTHCTPSSTPTHTHVMKATFVQTCAGCMEGKALFGDHMMVCGRRATFCIQ